MADAGGEGKRAKEKREKPRYGGLALTEKGKEKGGGRAEPVSLSDLRRKFVVRVFMEREKRKGRRAKEGKIVVACIER